MNVCFWPKAAVHERILGGAEREMKKIDLGQGISILANVGVLVGILLLVYELSLNRQMVEAQTRHQVAQGIVDQLAEVASNPELADLAYRARCGRLESEVEELRFFSWVNSRLRYWEDAHYQYRLGLYSESEFLANKEAWGSFIQTAAVQENWNRMKRSFSPEFVAEIDDLIDTGGAFIVPGCG